MVRSKKSGMVWRPIEYVMLGVALLLIILLVWMVQEIKRQDAGIQSEKVSDSKDDTSISQIVERGIDAEQQVDITYDSWEEASNSSVDGAADDAEGVINESSY